MTRFRRGIVAGVVSLLVLGGACSGADEPDLSAPGDVSSSTRDTASSDDADRSGDDATEGDDAAAEIDGEALQDETYYVAESLNDQLVVRDSASAAAQEVVRLSTTDAVSGRIVCLVLQQVGDFVQVELPASPGHATGWVQRDDVALSRHRFRIEVARGARTLTLYSGAVVALSTSVSIGPDAPAAGERLFVTELVRPPDPAGPYGAYAYGLSGAVNDLAAFTAGQGVVAVHGVPDPAVLGTDTATGSIGVAGDIIARMADTLGLPLGTPVDVVA
jgi:hypothetical protein